MRNIAFVISLFFIQNAFAQIKLESFVVATTKKDSIFQSHELEIKPDFPGGIDKFHRYVASNFINPQNNEISGVIYLTFIVEIDGTLSNIDVIRGIDPLTNAEAVRVVKLSPKWKPGKIGDKIVKSKYAIYIKVTNNL